LLTLAFAPLKQFYLAWIALVPWLVFLARTRSTKSAFFWSILLGVTVGHANIAWLMPVTNGGEIGLVFYMALYWGFAALLIRPLLLYPLSPALSAVEGSILYPLLLTVLVPTIWIALEFIRGNLCTGIPWLYLGHTQTPILTMCQISDTFGVYGVTFWVVAVNTLIALFFFVTTPKSEISNLKFEIKNLLDLPAATAAVILVLAGAFIYGRHRLAEQTTSPGPTITVIQSNFPQSNTGTKGATEEGLVNFHIEQTQKALALQAAAGIHSDLVVWSETMMPSLNPEARDFLSTTKYGAFIEQTHQRLGQLAKRFDVSILAGGIYYGSYREEKNTLIPLDRRNVAYFYDPTGQLSATRYDKIHLVPFGEFVPFKTSIPWLYKFLLSLSPYDYDYTVQPGDENAIPVYTLSPHASGKPVRFVTPICFEDVDSRLVARMFRGPHRSKRADLIVNLTNDGWFKAPELPQHLQIAIFRSIETRAPTARAVNTGLSGFIDSCGRTHDMLPIHTEGASTATIELDSRIPLYIIVGDLFAAICVVITGLAALWLIYAAWAARRNKVHNQPGTALNESGA
jgi:apolipoprotein N-acyltransferase